MIITTRKRRHLQINRKPGFWKRRESTLEAIRKEVAERNLRKLKNNNPTN